MAKVVAFEGIDGSGKSVQAAMLHEAARKSGLNVLLRSYPQYDSFIGMRIGSLLKDKENGASKIDAHSMSLWYASDRLLDYKKNIENVIRSVDLIIFNRYTLSSQIFQAARSPQSDIFSWIDELEHVEFGLPRPDLYFILDADPFITRKRNEEKTGREYIDSGADVYESDASLQSSVTNMYRKLSTERDDVALVPSAHNGQPLTMQEINERIRSELRHRLQLQI